MDDSSLTHTKWKCQYHIVFIPKYRRKTYQKAFIQKSLLTTIVSNPSREVLELEIGLQGRVFRSNTNTE